ncbi:MurR/RpiR family transcriptional regulator [Mesobacillus subterraneus]|uniref:RpiR family transcriptional regulator n=1 Tax=Mesobacillus subterraneus TaxID=285983 RepID=A0A0D6ZDC6_9BACI|nr:MurR/RpiR family transcriptional regulator [Mesobacillus subterraneus]KIY23804.1 RpiR family transcriptional regulator [Mesobacillus subterraneus]
MSSLLKLIKKELSRFSDTERKIGEFILSNPELVPSMTTKELAKSAEVSEASVTRFCRSIGINSFRLFKMQLMKDVTVANGDLTTFTSLEKKDSVYDLFRKVTYANQGAIVSSLASLDRVQLENAVEALIKAKKVIFYGVGGSVTAAYDGGYKFARIGYQTTSSPDFHYNITVIPHLQKDDVFIGISLSGKTKNVIELATFAKEQGATVIAITKMNRSPLYKLADITLCVPSMEEDFRIGTITSRMVQLNIIDTLYLSVFHMLGDEVLTAFKKAQNETMRLRK